MAKISISVNTNLTSILAQRSLNKATLGLSSALERMSTGLRINTAKDDAAGMAVSTKLDTKISSYDVAMHNTNDGLSYIQTASSTLDIMGDKLQRMRDLAEQAANGTYGQEERRAIQAEVDKLADELLRVKNSAEYNGKKLFNSPIEETQAIETTSKPYKAQLEYLESTGTQWVGTGYIPNDNTKINIKYEFTQLAGMSWVFVFGNYISERHNNTRIIQQGEARPFVNSNTRAGNGTEVNLKLVNNVYTDTLSKDKYISNGQEYSINDVAGTKNLTEMALFAGSINGHRPAKVRIYSTQIYDGDTLVHDFIPVVDNNDIACMYDKVSGQFFYNQGTGEFVQGPVVPDPPPESSFKTDEINLQVGLKDNENSVIKVASMLDIDDFKVDVLSETSACSALDRIDEMRAIVLGENTKLGATANRLMSVLDSTATMRTSATAASSLIKDADIAVESSNYIKNQILQQMSSTLLATANQSPNIALQLI